VIFDEFHERSLQADLGLALAIDAQRHLRDDLRLARDVRDAAGHRLGRWCSTRTSMRAGAGAAPIAVDHASRQAPRVAAIRRSRGDTGRRAARARTPWSGPSQADPGDALVFLPGAAEIPPHLRSALGIARRIRNSTCCRCTGSSTRRSRMPRCVPRPAGRRKVVVATNIAETSLTIDGVRIVVDSGVERRPRFDPNTGMSRLETVRISRASADQRRGRAGRTAPGTCYRLWSESEHAALAPQSAPEILEADLGPLALELACWGVTDPAALAWVDVPPLATFRQARALLRELEALDDRGQATLVGRRMARQACTRAGAHAAARSCRSGSRDSRAR
jgi:ATP-dependent helicase HrpB